MNWETQVTTNARMIVQTGLDQIQVQTEDGLMTHHYPDGIMLDDVNAMIEFIKDAYPNESTYFINDTEAMGYDGEMLTITSDGESLSIPFGAREILWLNRILNQYIRNELSK